MIKLFIDKVEHEFTTTIFPDGTSQVWKIKDIPDWTHLSLVEIVWIFENEAELIHVCQLARLVNEEVTDVGVIIAPYLPYARQDKSVANGQSFALETMKRILNGAGIHRIITFDAHSKSNNVVSLSPVEFHKSIFNHDVVCFPDKGAAERYGNADAFGNAPIIHCEKIRNQATGEITGLKVVGATPDLLTDKRVLIVDDICDGGMTFIKVSEALQSFQPRLVDLAVSHGIFSKGKHVLHAAGIKNIFTTNSLLRNPEGFKVW